MFKNEIYIADIPEKQGYYALLLAIVKKISVSKAIQEIMLQPLGDENIINNKKVIRDINHRIQKRKKMSSAEKLSLPKISKKREKIKGIKNPNSKLTEKDVYKIKLFLKKGKLSKNKIAYMFNVSHRQIRRIETGENWGHIEVNE